MNVIQDKTLRALVATAQAQGWFVAQCSSGHVKFMPPHPDLTMVVASKSASDSRAINNVRAELRRRGLVLPQRG